MSSSAPPKSESTTVASTHTMVNGAGASPLALEPKTMGRPGPSMCNVSRWSTSRKRLRTALNSRCEKETATPPGGADGPSTYSCRSFAWRRIWVRTVWRLSSLAPTPSPPALAPSVAASTSFLSVRAWASATRVISAREVGKFFRQSSTTAGSARSRCGHTEVSYTALIEGNSWKARSNFLRRPEAHMSCTRMYASDASVSSVAGLPRATCNHTRSMPCVERKMDVRFFRCSLTDGVVPGATCQMHHVWHDVWRELRAGDHTSSCTCAHRVSGEEARLQREDGECGLRSVEHAEGRPLLVGLKEEVAAKLLQAREHRPERADALLLEAAFESEGSLRHREGWRLQWRRQWWVKGPGAGRTTAINYERDTCVVGPHALCGVRAFLSRTTPTRARACVSLSAAPPHAAWRKTSSMPSWR